MMTVKIKRRISSTRLLYICLIVAVSGFVFLNLPARGVKGKIKTVYFWGITLVSKLHDNISWGPSAPLLRPIREGSATGPLRVNPENGRYFTDGTMVHGKYKAVYLTGSHTWLNFQDSGGGYPPPAFDYNAYLDFMIRNNHNFFRLWTWEQSRWTAETSDNNYWFYPGAPFQRTGPGNALDGRPKFDLT